MFPFFNFTTDNKFPVNVPIERDVNLPWSQITFPITFPISGDFNLPWSTVQFMPVENRMPLSGAVNQDISTEWDTGSDAALSAALEKEAGPFGAQLTTMMDAMEHMWGALGSADKARLAPENNEAMAKFQALADIHKKVRADHKNQHMAAVRDKIEELMHKDPDAASQLLTAFMDKLGAAKTTATEEPSPLSLPAPKG